MEALIVKKARDFCKAFNINPANAKQIKLMIKLEARFLQELDKNSIDDVHMPIYYEHKLERSVETAYDNIVEWFTEAKRYFPYYTLTALRTFVASNRRTCVWAVLFGLERSKEGINIVG